MVPPKDLKSGIQLSWKDNSFGGEDINIEHDLQLPSPHGIGQNSTYN